MSAPFFLLSRRPGWRRAPLLSTGVDVADGVLRLGTEPPPSVFDLPRAGVLDLPDCRRAVLDGAGRRVLLVSGTGQVLKVAGPWRIAAGHAEQVRPGRGLTGPGCAPEVTWPEGTWRPVGLALLADGRVGVLDAGHLVHVLDCDARFAGTLEELLVPGVAEPRFAREGTLVAGPLDSGLPGCRWHRVELAGTVPPGCRVEVQTLTTDADLGEAEVALLDDRWVSAAVLGELVPGAAWDALVASAPGQWLWLRLVLGGDGTRTPELAEAAVHFPRQTSLRHLPAVFAAGEADFLDRFLALTEDRKSVV